MSDQTPGNDPSNMPPPPPDAGAPPPSWDAPPPPDAGESAPTWDAPPPPTMGDAPAGEWAQTDYAAPPPAADYAAPPPAAGYGDPYATSAPPMAYPGVPPGYQPKQKMVAGLLGIFLGAWGVHSFYLGDSKKGVIQIVVSLVTCGIGGLWGLIEGVMILTGNINTDANGVPLVD